jgi:ribonuclease HI
MPLVELTRNPIYKKQIAKAINFSEAACQDDVINSQDEKPTIMFGPHIENSKDLVAMFYITLTMHNHLLHNCMLDSGTSHNLISKIIMENLGLEITKPYQDLYSFDSRKVKCLGMIKDLVVNLAQVPVKITLMDVVVADVPTKYGMLLSRSWGAKLGGSVQRDMTYATIPIFGGQFTRLYKETRLAYIMSDHQNPNNYPVYVTDQDLGNCILTIDDDFEECIEEENQKIEISKKNRNVREGMWKMFFDGASSYEGEGVGVLFVAPGDEYVILLSYGLQWDIDYTNIVFEYEALVLGLEAVRKLKIEHLMIYGDAELIVKQTKQHYQAKHPISRSYRNCSLDLIDNLFSSFNIHSIPIMQNQQVDSLAKVVVNFIPPIVLKLKYHIEMRHRPLIPKTVQHWKVFEDDEQIKQFL